MKRLLSALAMTVLLGACGESSTNVASNRGRPDGGEFIPPDTTLKSGSVAVNVYGPENEKTIAAEATLSNDDAVASGFAQLELFGFSYSPGNALVASTVLAGGEKATITMLPTSAASGELGQLVHVRVDDEEVVRAYRLHRDENGEVRADVLHAGSKGSSSPAGVPLIMSKPMLDVLACLVTVLAQYSACVWNCCRDCDDSGSFRECVKACYNSAAVSLATCLFMSSL